ncbi:hypothetical protein HYDPIDRAFT_177108 [Hydnomerulius pinastri MD-312]|uniref:Uncharacterized protein n=1 Tax=Hydnomerulius pinastri MD-312 TaxID=994086 RepID=A0A0C9V6J0_9AGAM|nr:hypothetical protein HYDPIDRAFT_177108 [Hydnomerulius pinastri MD-312]
MVEKTLSSGTMNLRFMQNARRAQQLAQVEPEQAYVKDDAEWEVAAETREAWGLSANPDEKAVIYETSYLPFLLPSLHDTPAADEVSSLSRPNALRPRGRRVFNKQGEELTQQASSSTVDVLSSGNIPSVDQEAGENTKRSRPQTISSAGKSATTARQAKKPKDPSKDAKNVIYDTTGVGTDLRQTTMQRAAPGTSSFLRPSGIDGPVGLTKSSETTKPSREVQSSTGAMNSSKSNAKRSRTLSDADKLKKKTKLTLIE